MYGYHKYCHILSSSVCSVAVFCKTISFIRIYQALGSRVKFQVAKLKNLLLV